MIYTSLKNLIMSKLLRREVKALNLEKKFLRKQNNLRELKEMYVLRYFAKFRQFTD